MTGSWLACGPVRAGHWWCAVSPVWARPWLDYLAGRASECLVARAAGVQSEMELAFAGLHQLCAPMLDHAEALPVPQREALRTAFGLSAGPVPDRFLVGLATDWALGTEARSRALLVRADRRERLSRGDRAARPYPHAPGRGPRPPVRRMAAPREPAPGRPRRAADRPWPVHHDGHRGVRRAGPARAAGHRRHGAQADGQDGERAHRPGGAHRPARRRRRDQRGDRDPAIPQHPDRRMASQQGVHQARSRLPPGLRRALASLGQADPRA